MLTQTEIVIAAFLALTLFVGGWHCRGEYDDYRATKQQIATQKTLVKIDTRGTAALNSINAQNLLITQTLQVTNEKNHTGCTIDDAHMRVYNAALTGVYSRH